MHKQCINCNTTIYKQPSDSIKYWNKKKYCSIKCSGTLFRKGDMPANGFEKGLWGEKSANYKGGRSITIQGYIRVLVEGTSRYVLEHRMVMEKHIGRKLDRKEHIHHKNHDKTDNRIENLEIISIYDHGALHSKERWDKYRQLKGI